LTASGAAAQDAEKTPVFHYSKVLKPRAISGFAALGGSTKR
jgi:hypothetical protein